MLQNIRIELLKTRRTHTYLILLILMVISSAWQLFAANAELVHPELKEISVLYNNQTVDCLLVPVMVSIFSSKIISNEKEGQTFKLQKSNGTGIRKIFLSKLCLMMSIFMCLFVMEAAIRYVYALVNGLHTSMLLVLFFLLGQMLTALSLSYIFLGLSFLLDKQGVVLAFGFLFGFLGTVLESRSQSILSFWLPGTGNAYLAPYKYHLLSNDQLSYTYIQDQTLLIRVLIYIALCFLLRLIVYRVIQKKGVSQI